MAVKLTKNVYPVGHLADDFECFGPVCDADGEFSKSRIADLGCFTQDSSDTNKYYHAAVVQSKTNKNWYAYFEWGRTGASKPNFQFVECSSESDAQEAFADQLMDKNAKRGEWVQIAGIRTLRAKSGKDCYLVRCMAQRSSGLPDGRKIVHTDGAKTATATAVATAVAKPTKGKAAVAKVVNVSKRADSQTLSLMKDLSVATVNYAKKSIVGNAIPSQKSIDEARLFLIEAEKRLLIVGDDINAQTTDREMLDLTSLIYGRIPKIKPVNAPVATWALSSGNILNWRQDLDAFESALMTNMAQVESPEPDPFAGMPIKYMEWVSPTSALGKFIYGWWPSATRNRHGSVGSMQIKNAWKFERENDFGALSATQDAVIAEKAKIGERPLHQPERNDLSSVDQKKVRDSNTALMFHGTRSVNVKGILNKSLLLPKQLVGVSINGAMFGPGLYWADDWKKSDGYTSRYGSYYNSGGGGIQSRGAFMFAGEVVCGSAFVAPGPRGYTEPPSGNHCVFGKAGHSQVQNNEWIVFNRVGRKEHQQCALKYLVEYDCR
jgi:hypothetical protein